MWRRSGRGKLTVAERLERLETLVKELQNTLTAKNTALEETLNKMSERLYSMETSLNAKWLEHDRREEGLTAKVEVLDTTLTHKVKALGDRLDLLEKKLSKLRSSRRGEPYLQG